MNRRVLRFAVLHLVQEANRIQVLVVGSDVGKRTALVDILEECGLEPMIASNVEETRHVVFCEDNLPDGGFREIHCLVKANRPEIQEGGKSVA
jgi:hypothetical protein